MQIEDVLISWLNPENDLRVPRRTIVRNVNVIKASSGQYYLIGRATIEGNDFFVRTYNGYWKSIGQYPDAE